MIETSLMKELFIPSKYLQTISIADRNTRKRREICAKLAMKTPERSQ